jgi:hypothetical protein
MRTATCCGALLGVVVAVSLPPTSAGGQTRTRSVLGQAVRITAPAVDLDRHVGPLLALRTDTLVVGGDSSIAVAVADVVRFEVRSGTRRHPGRGAGIGFLAGAVVGAGAGVWFASAGEETCQIGAAGCIAVGTVLVGGAGAVIGAGVGALIATPKWRTIPVNSLHVHVVPQGERLAVAFRLGF